jgi:UDP-glucose 4-epimerase
MKKYLITGGAGFIGSHLARALLKLGKKVVVIDNFSTSALKNIGSEIKIYKTDIDDSAKIFKKEKPDVVFHLAGAINLRRDVADPLCVKDLNFLQRTKVILDACREFKVQKFIFVSSGGAIYENAKEIPTSENYLSHPASLYGLANLIIEKYIELYCNKNNLNFVLPRLSNVYGPGQWESGVIPSIIINLLKNQSPVINGLGNQTRDFIYIDDAVEALIVLAEKGKNEIYNVGTEKEVSLNEIFKLAKNITGAKVDATYKDSKVTETTKSAVDIKKIQKEFGWRPKTSIKEGLKNTIEYYAGKKV